MVGRGAVGKPWIFAMMKEYINNHNTNIDESKLIREVVLEHFTQMINHYGDYGAILFRKHLHTYSKAGYMGASKFRDTINRVDSPLLMHDIIDEFFSSKRLDLA